MKRKRFSMNIFFVNLIVVASLILVGTASAKEKVYRLKINHELVENNFHSDAEKVWMNKIEKESNGRVKFINYWSGTLLNSDTAYQELKAGVAEIGDGIHRYTKDGFKIAAVWKLLTAGVPPGYDTTISKALWEKFPEIRNEFKEFKVLSFAENLGNPYALNTNKKPIRKMEDFKGLEFWSEADFIPWFKEMGANAINAPFPELYTLMQKGTFDGYPLPTETLLAFNFADVVKYVTMVDIVSANQPGPLMNMKTWNSLPKDIQDIFDRNADIIWKENDKGMVAAEKAGIKYAKKKGIEFIVLSKKEHQKILDALNKAQLQEAAKLDAQGLPGTEIVNEVRRLSEKYSKGARYPYVSVD